MPDTAHGSVLLAFALTAGAGLATGIGSAIALLTSRTNKGFLSFALGLSAGVMIYVSFVELLVGAFHSLGESLGPAAGRWAGAGAFFGGFAAAMIVDMLVPDPENPHAFHVAGGAPGAGERSRLMRLGVMTAVIIGVHNFPEGLAAFAAALSDTRVGVSIAIAIAIHNIPEGISVSVPIHAATGSRKKAFWYSFLSGLAEPAGALLGFALLRPFFSQTLFGVLFGVVAGIMVFISLDELIPAAKEYGKGHAAICGMGLGMLVMAVSLLV